MGNGIAELSSFANGSAACQCSCCNKPGKGIFSSVPSLDPGKSSEDPAQMQAAYQSILENAGSLLCSIGFLSFLLKVTVTSPY